LIFNLIQWHGKSGRRDEMRNITLAFAFVCSLIPAHAADRFITLASTTSTEQSGLFAHILPEFQKVSGIEVRVVALGTGQALALAARGDADALLVHDRPAEEKFIADGHGLDRRDVMYNDFVLIGPKADPAKVMGGKDITAAFKAIAAAKAAFTSRGDKSGTHSKELRVWKAAGLAPTSSDTWYRELGKGMGPTLNTASAMNAYVLADRGTWLNFGNRGDLVIVLEGDKSLFNPYSSILVSPAKGTHIKATDARVWHEWLTSPAGQAAIAGYQIGGKQLFFPSAAAPKS
jgi:tungstate transport system substrate-binding protein